MASTVCLVDNESCLHGDIINNPLVFLYISYVVRVEPYCLIALEVSLLGYNRLFGITVYSQCLFCFPDLYAISGWKKLPQWTDNPVESNYLGFPVCLVDSIECPSIGG